MAEYKIVEINYLPEVLPSYYESWTSFYKDLCKSFDFSTIDPDDRIILNEFDGELNVMFSRKFSPVYIQRKALEELSRIPFTLREISLLRSELKVIISNQSLKVLDKIIEFLKATK